MKPFRFLADARDIASVDELRETARRAEAIGIDTLAIPDHLIQQLAPMAAMAAIVSVSDRLRVTGFVLNNDLRHPAVMAQELASIDVLSGGRLDVAIGGGWNRAEYEAIGLPFDRTPVRQARLAEAIAVLKGGRGWRIARCGARVARGSALARPAERRRVRPARALCGANRPQHAR